MVVPGLVSMTFFMCCSILLYLTIRQRLLRSSRTSQHNVLNNSQSMATQALLYSIFFFNTNIWLTLSFLIFFIGDVEKAKVPFAILVLGDLFWLSQGFFNFIIFIRPRFVRIFHRMRESDRQNSSSSPPRRSVILSFLSALRETVYYETGGNRSHITTSSEGGNDKNWIRSLFSRNRRSKQAPDIDIKSSQDQPKQEQREIPSLQFDNRQGCWKCESPILGTAEERWSALHFCGLRWWHTRDRNSKSWILPASFKTFDGTNMYACKQFWNYKKWSFSIPVFSEPGRCLLYIPPSLPYLWKKIASYDAKFYTLAYLKH